MKKRIAALNKAAKKTGVSAMYVRDTANIEWITGFTGVFDDERAHSLFVSTHAKKAFLHTDSRYYSAMAAQRKGSGVKVDDDRISPAKWAKKLWHNTARRGDRLGIEDSMTLAECNALTKEIKDRDLVQTHDVILKLRAVKDEEEINRIRHAQAITDEAFKIIVGQIKPGITEREIQRRLDDIMFRLGADGLAFPTIVAAGANGANPHAQPGDTRLEAGMCVVMDFGAKKCGYCSDMTRTVFIGQPEGDMLRAWKALRAANESVEAELKAGMTGKEAHELAERTLESGGFGGCMGHSLGHGVGLQIHELPLLSPRNAKPIHAGSVVTVEPGIYIDGVFGMRLEDMGVVHEDRFEVLTQSTHSLVVV